MSAIHARRAAFATTAIAVLLLTGCAAESTTEDPADAPDSAVTTEAVTTEADAGETPAEEAPAEEPVGEHPEGLDASLPVPPGTLISATQIASAWEYIYGDVTSDEARAFADGLLASGFEKKVSVDSNGVEQWYMQSADWAIKLEQTHDTETLLYWVDPIIE